MIATRTLVLATAAIATPLGSGCASRVVTVGALDVSPTQPLPRPTGAVALALAPVTPDAIRIQTPGFPIVEIASFRTTLRGAFERAFAVSSAPASQGPAETTLVLEVTELAFVTEHEARASRAAGRDWLGAGVVLAHGSAPHTPKAKPRRLRYARLRFTASLRERGVEVARLVGFATADEGSAGSERSVAGSVASAVTALRDRITRELFQRSTASLSPED